MKYKISTIQIIIIFFLGCKLQVYSYSENESKNTRLNNKTNISVIASEKKTSNCKFVLENNIFCEPLKDLDFNPEIKNPVDLVVTKDGATIYVTTDSVYASTLINTPPGFSGCQDNESKPLLLKRNFIYKINSDKTVKIVKINGIAPESCRFGSEIEIDNKNNLFVNDISHNLIYKLSESDNRIEKLIELKETDLFKENDTFTTPKPSSSNMQGPVNLQIINNNLYFAMFSDGLPGGTIIRKIEKDKSIKFIYSGEGQYFSNIYSIFNDKLYLGYLLEGDLSQVPLNESNFKSYEYNPLALKDIKSINNVKINLKGEMFFVDKETNSIWKVIIGKNIIRFAGNGMDGFKDGKGSEAEFNLPSRMDFDNKDNLYVADTGNNAIRKITPDGTVSTFYVQKFLFPS